jgi:hypothetical protein
MNLDFKQILTYSCHNVRATQASALPIRHTVARSAQILQRAPVQGPQHWHLAWSPVSFIEASRTLVRTQGKTGMVTYILYRNLEDISSHTGTPDAATCSHHRNLEVVTGTSARPDAATCSHHRNLEVVTGTSAGTLIL